MRKLALAATLGAALGGVTLLPRPAAAQIAVSVQLPSAHVSVNEPQGHPPGPGFVWEPPRWVMVNGAWVRERGYWRQVAPQPVVVAPPVVYQPEPEYPVTVEVAPPAPMVEAAPAPPVTGAVWIPGHWRWSHHRHHWIPGRWSAPRPGYVWQAPRWSRHGHRWAYAPGYWDRVDHRDRHDGRHGRDRHRHGYRRNHGHDHRR